MDGCYCGDEGGEEEEGFRVGKGRRIHGKKQTITMGVATESHLMGLAPRR